MPVHPKRYYKGLSKAAQRKRKKEIEQRKAMDHRDPKAYRAFETNEGIETEPSQYNEDFASRYRNPLPALKKKAKESGIPLSILEKVWARGMAAWRTGHRPGASQHAWGMARVNSFATGGKTYFTADQDLARELEKRKGIKFTKDRRLVKSKRKRKRNPDAEPDFEKMNWASFLATAAAFGGVFWLGTRQPFFQKGLLPRTLLVLGATATAFAVSRLIPHPEKDKP